MIADKTITVTGGAGFIGSNLCEKLLALGNRVVCLDNLLTGKRHNIDFLNQFPEFTFIEGDIRDIEKCRESVAGSDYVFHEAALGSVPRSIENPVLSTEINISGTLNMLIAARDAGVERFVFAGSSSVYGDSATLPKVEDVTGNPLSPYAVTKHVNELHAKLFFELYGLKTTGLRYFNVFGDRQDTESIYAAVIPKFVKSFMELQSPVIYGDGLYTRDFTYIENVIHANMLAAVSGYHGYEVYNIACGAQITLKELVAKMQTILAGYNPEIAKVKVVYGENRAGDIPHSLADISKAHKNLGYEPLYSLEQGLVKAIKWYWNNL